VTQLTCGFWIRIALALCALGTAISAHAQAPTITKQPSSQNLEIGGVATFSVEVDRDSENVRYQWRLNGGNIPAGIFPSLVVSNAQPTNAGFYTVVVYNDAGAETSDPAELRFNGPAFLNFSDSFADAPVITNPSGLGQGDNFRATPETGEPQHNGRPPRKTVWATWLAPPAAPGIVTFRAVGTFDTILAVYTGNLSTGLTKVRSDDDSGGFLSSQVSFRTQPQTLYRIVIDGFGGAEGRFLFDWKFEPTVELLPIFDLEPIDQTVGTGTDVTFSVAGSTEYSWQWFFNSKLISGETKPTLIVKDVGPNEVGEYFCRAFSGQRFRDSRSARLQIALDEFGKVDPSSFTTEKLFDARLRLNDFAALAGKSKGAAKTISHGFSGTQIFSTAGATKEPGEPNHCGVAGGASEWFAVQADTNGTMYIDTDGSSFDTVLAVYKGPGDDFSTLVSVACDNNSGLDGKDSRVAFPATQGTIYWIAVDGVNNPSTGVPAKGSVSLHFRLVLPLRLSSMAYTNGSGGRMTFKVSGTPNLPATVEVSTNVNAALWTPLTTNSAASGTFNYTNNGVGGTVRRFYRAVNKF
jgi:hypothetical protein